MMLIDNHGVPKEYCLGTTRINPQLHVTILLRPINEEDVEFVMRREDNNAFITSSNDLTSLFQAVNEKIINNNTPDKFIEDAVKLYKKAAERLTDTFRELAEPRSYITAAGYRFNIVAVHTGNGALHYEARTPSGNFMVSGDSIKEVCEELEQRINII